MKIYDFFIWLRCLVALYNNVSKIFHLCDDFFILLYAATKRLSRIRNIINIHHQCSLPDTTPSASSVKIHFHISDFDTQYCITSRKAFPSISFSFLLTKEVVLCSQVFLTLSSQSQWPVCHNQLRRSESYFKPTKKNIFETILIDSAHWLLQVSKSEI